VINFILGFLAGGFLGVIITALCVASGRYNDQYEKYENISFFEEKDIEKPEQIEN
jgi:zinc transporter ZupT